MIDDGLSKEEAEINFIQFDSTDPAYYDSTDPAYYEEAVKCEKWRAVTDSEIKAIESNNTWQLTDLTVSEKKIGV